MDIINSKILYYLLLLVVLFTASECWVLKASDHSVTRKISANVSLECIYDDDDNGLPKFKEIYEIRILKFISDKKWDTIARISALHSGFTSLIDPEYVTGHTGTPSNSYLNITFPTATTETVGKFMCDIAGYNHLVHTDPVVINERGVNYDDILNIIEDMKEEEKNDQIDDQLKLKLMNDSINILQKKEKSIGMAIVRNANQIGSLSEDVLALKKEEIVTREECKTQIETSVTNISTKLTNEINKVTKKLLELKQEMEKQMTIKNDQKSLFKYDSSKVWPAGTYGMLKPKTDCPYSPLFDWANGTVKISTDKRVSNSDEISVPSNMAGTVLQHDDTMGYNSVNMELCVKQKHDKGPAWPVGHYCILSYSGNTNEVVDFNFGYIEIDRYDISEPDTVVNAWSYLTNGITRIGFWCRQDGYATTPIVLPSKDPFYLYRFGGKCQVVKGMDVIDEWVEFDTMRIDEYENDWHPDGTVSPVRIQMCYYTPRL